LPLALYQIQNKFRDEKRAKSGLLRGREFIMKDLYSFHTSEEDLDAYYKIAHDAYLKIFSRLGLQAFSVEASGGAMSSNNSHEFMVKTDAGEDLTIFCENCSWAQNSEITELKDADQCPDCQKTLKVAKTVEAGNIFRLYTKYSKDMELKFTDQTGKQQLVLMGCYGIGLGRIMGTVVEASHDENGIIWTKNTTPYQVHLLNLTKDNKADKLYADLEAEGIEVLYDDRDLSFGKKIKDADLIGICLQVIISDKEDLEVTDRQTGEKKFIKIQALQDLVKNYYN
jgi:prolyl-tRNA synthetase